MSDYQLDLNEPAVAYMFGFLQADGHLYANSRNRGKLTLELKSQDRWILEQFARLVPFYSSIKQRTRTTNFKEHHSSVVWAVHNRSFRDALILNGVPTGKKSDKIAVPPGEYSQCDYYRGIIDADGSLGITGNGFPFVSIITASTSLAGSYNEFLREKLGCHKQVRRNNRDNVFNITVFKEDAQALATLLYYDSCLALPRKQAKVPDLLNWQRPDGMTKKFCQGWCEAQDRFILNHSITEAALHLGRTEQSIKMRLWRLKGKEVTD